MKDDHNSVPLTLEELEALAREEKAVWCEDREGLACGVLTAGEDWREDQAGPHIHLPNEAGGLNEYSVPFMLELGAQFYRSWPGGAL